MIEDEFTELMSTPNSDLKTKVLQPRFEPPFQQHYPYPNQWQKYPQVEGEMYNWRRRFVGLPALAFKHCVLIIKIRREHDLERHLNAFFELWEQEGQFLREILNVKWLVSACDTFSDHSPDDAERATALIASSIVKTIKLYETEMLFRFKRLDPLAWPVYKNTLIFDGLYSFNIGYGDVVNNLKRRIKDITRRGTPPALILNELFERICKFNTAYSRLRAEHTCEQTSW
jgi:hypothetical protein